MLFSKKPKKGTPKENSDQRKNTRIDLYQATYYKMPHDSPNSVIHDCWLNNISSGGISFDTNNNEIAQGDQIMLLYRLETNIRKDLVTVRHVRQVFNNWRYGCKFNSEDENRAKSIDSFIDKYLKQDPK